jgi:gluconate 5-dehydrogenase
VVLSGRDADRLTTVAAELSGDVHTTAFDVTDNPSVAAGAADVEERVGPLDILVNNAGMQLPAPLLEFTDADGHRSLYGQPAQPATGDGLRTQLVGRFPVMGE